jgi:DeoR family fructose operon transcriptional repressor
MSRATHERRDQIIARLISHKHVMVKDLSEELAVSDATVRRDLQALADSGEVELVHGGARLANNADFSFQNRMEHNRTAKQVIGQLAAGLVDDGDQLFIDSGTTCLTVAAHLRQRSGVNVIANSARVARELDNSGVEVIMVGGKYRPQRMDCVGPIANATLEQLRGYIAFIGADGLSMDFGPSASDIDSAATYRQAVKNARQTVLLVDHTKFAEPSLYKIVEWDAIDQIVTDRAPDESWLEFFTRQEIAVVCPEAVESLNR